MPGIAMTSPFFVWASSRSSDPRVFSRLANDVGRFLAIEHADVNPDDARERHVEMVLPGRREPQRFLADALELAEEFFVARQIEPGIGPAGQPSFLGSTASLGSVCSWAMVVGIAGLAILVHDHDREVLLMAVARRRLEEEVGGRCHSPAGERPAANPANPWCRAASSSGPCRSGS